MPSITPIYAYAKPPHFLREMLADSTMWQAMVHSPEATCADLVAMIAATPGVLSEATARESIVLGIIPTDAEGYSLIPQVPKALIRYLSDGVKTRTTTSSYESNMLLMLLIEYRVPHVYRLREAVAMSNAEIDGLDKIGRIVEQLKTSVLSGAADMLQIESFTFGPHGLIAPEEGENEQDGEWIRTAEIQIRFMGAC